MKWYFAINERGLTIQENKVLITASVNSCLANTNLRPHCLYSGGNENDILFLESLGVNVIRHTPVLEAELKEGYGDLYKTFDGHWLRCDLPLIEDDEEVLYTDTDIIFLKSPDLSILPNPKYFAAAPEFTQSDRSYFNSGVMLMNLKNLRSIMDLFHNSIRRRLSNSFSRSGHDQKSLNDFFFKSHEWLPNEFNWKPYWGVNDKASIIHFHGPKPSQVIRFINNDFKGIPENVISLWKKNIEAYDVYLEEYNKYLAS